MRKRDSGFGKDDILILFFFALLLVNIILQIIYTKTAAVQDLVFFAVLFLSVFIYQFFKAKVIKQLSYQTQMSWNSVFFSIIAILSSFASGILICRSAIASRNLSLYSNIIIIFLLVMNILFLLIDIIELSLLWLVKRQFSKAGILIAISLIQIIVLFAIVYAGIFALDISSFRGISLRSPYSLLIDFVYFSVVTFTTLGYGDIAPVSEAAKIAVMIEALFFVIYISIFLVNLIDSKKRDNYPKVLSKDEHIGYASSQEGESSQNDN